MKTLFAVLLSAVVTTPAWAQGGTELFLVQLKRDKAALTADSVLRLTNRAGYDNQPAFVPGTSYVLYTSIDSTSRADIWRYDLATRTTALFTRTQPESEYSATPMPNGNRFSVVRVEADSTQRLWSFNGEGTDPRIVLAGIKPVGYHLWLDEQRVVVFVLGQPPSLQIADVRTGTAHVIAHDIGRALVRVPGRNAFSFVQHNADSTSSIVVYDAGTRLTRAVTRTLPQNEYHVWLRDGTLISANGSVLYQWREGDRGWVFLADLSRAGVRGISRIALIADEIAVVIVAAEP